MLLQLALELTQVLLLLKLSTLMLSLTDSGLEFDFQLLRH